MVRLHSIFSFARTTSYSCAFMQHFAQAKRAEIVAANPGIGITGVATKVSEIWKTLKPAGTRSFIPKHSRI
jgi:hypothetical protein